MADTAQTNTLFDGTRRKIIQLLGYSDGTGESAVVKVDASADSNADYYSVQEIEYDISGFSNVQLEFDATTNDELIHLPAGSGAISFVSSSGLVDPKSTGSTGDIVLTSNGAAADATYNIVIHLVKKTT